MGPPEKHSTARFGLCSLLVFWARENVAFGNVGDFWPVKYGELDAFHDQS